jgi:hypothetical protein
MLSLGGLAIVAGTLLSHQVSHDAARVMTAAPGAVSSLTHHEIDVLTTHLGDAHVQPASPGTSAGELVPVCVEVLSSVLLGMLLVDLWPGLGRLPRPPPALARTRGPTRVRLNVSRNVLDATGVLRV